MIEVQGLHFKYAKAEPWILHDLNFKIRPGELVGLAGQNGSGKSTLAELLAGLLFPSSGRVMVDGLDSREHPPHMTGTVGLVFQNPEHQFFHTKVVEDVAFGPMNLGFGQTEVEARVDQVMREVGISELAQHSPHQLSGGQKQLVALAGILAMEPRYLILDEPTAMLDPSSRRRIRNLLVQLHKSRGCAVIWITQDMEELLVVQRAMMLYRGTLIADGNPQELLRDLSLLEQAGLEPPLSLQLELLLRQEGMGQAARLVQSKAMELLFSKP